MSLSVSRILSSSITLAGVSSWFVCRFLPLARRRRRRSNATSSWPSPSSSFVAFPGLVLARHLLASGPRCRFLLAGLVPSLRGSWWLSNHLTLLSKTASTLAAVGGDITLVFYTLYMDSSEDLSYEEEEEVLFWDDVILEDDNIDKEDYEFEDKDEHALEEIVCNGIVYDIEQVEEQELFLNEVIESSYTYRDDVYENEPGLMERWLKSGQLMMKTFVTERESERKNIIVGRIISKRGGCNARVQLQSHVDSFRWVVTPFCDQHNHKYLDPRNTRMLHSHRKVPDVDMAHIKNFRDGGLGPKSFGLLASQSKDYENVGYGLRDIHNKISKQRRQSLGDAATHKKVFSRTLSCMVKDYKVRLLIAVSLVCSDCNKIGNQEQQSGGMLTGLHSPV
ncbi:hypothetical protein Ahy_A07g036991 [Arachis hypogaea]|uniref:WRKY domain-containing protein n=1 Tax=Arachis hypogaea TaxID=3818 RepID=A0A445CHI8_ARAHY|nr:hypothetical protein Ahy_A07g036991 [Arachis hypogaea]